MNVNLTEDDIRAIWRDIYQGIVRDSQYTISMPERAHQTAIKAADAYVAALRADRKADDDALSAEVAARPPAEVVRTADDERRDAVAYLVESARCRQVTDYDSAVIAEGRHVGAASLYGPGREVRPISLGQPAKVARRTAEDERRDVLAYLRAKLASYATTFRSMPADLGWPRDSLEAQITLLDAVLIVEVERGDHVGAADLAEVKP